MEIFYTSRFERAYKKLPSETKVLAEKKELLFRTDPFEPRLKTHKLHGELKDHWAFSVTHEVRVIFEFTESNIVWFHSIGNHDIYE